MHETLYAFLERMIEHESHGHDCLWLTNDRHEESCAESHVKGYVEGFILDWTDTTLTVALGGPMAPEEPIQLSLNQVQRLTIHTAAGPYDWNKGNDPAHQ